MCCGVCAGELGTLNMLLTMNNNGIFGTLAIQATLGSRYSGLALLTGQAPTEYQCMRCTWTPWTQQQHPSNEEEYILYCAVRAVLSQHQYTKSPALPPPPPRAPPHPHPSSYMYGVTVARALCTVRRCSVFPLHLPADAGVL